MSILREQARRTGSVMAALVAAAVTAGGIAMAMGGGEPTLVDKTTSEIVLGPTSTTTTAVAEAPALEPAEAPTTTAPAVDRAELAAQRAEVAAGRSEKAAEKAEEIVKTTPSTSTPTTEAPTGGMTPTTVAPMPTTTTTAPKVYGWVEVARFSLPGGLSGAPLRADVTLEGGKLRVTGLPDVKSMLYAPQQMVFLGEDDMPAPVCPATEDNKGTVVDYSPRTTTRDCAWHGAWPAGPTVIRLGWYDQGRWVAPLDAGPDIVVEEWRVTG